MPASPRGARRRARGVQGAGDLHGAGLAAGQDDLAVLLLDRAGLDDPAHVDDAVDDALGRRRRHPNPAAVGEDFARVLHQRVGRLAVLVLRAGGDRRVGGEVDALVAVEVDHELSAGGQVHLAQARGDGAGVGDAGRHQGDQPGVGRGDGAVVLHHGGAVRRAFEAVAAGQEILVADVVRGGDQAGDVDLGVAAEDDAVRVDQPDLPVGAESPEDLRRVAADHPVERDGRGRGLLEAGVLALTDAEVPPLDDGLVGGLVDGEGAGRRFGDRRTAGHHRAAARVCRRRAMQRRGAGQCRGGDQEPAQCTSRLWRSPPQGHARPHPSLLWYHQRYQPE